MEIRPTPAPRPSLLTTKTTKRSPAPPVPPRPPGLRRRVKMIRAMNFDATANDEEDSCEDEEATGKKARTKALCVYFGQRNGLSRLFTAVAVVVRTSASLRRMHTVIRKLSYGGYRLYGRVDCYCRPIYALVDGILNCFASDRNPLIEVAAVLYSIRGTNQGLCVTGVLQNRYLYVLLRIVGE
uniref:Ribonuclease P n=1 Tax=Steinernema glaseri TaxID=37863 RepID=A0A1I7YWF6_9BILA